MHRRRFLAGGLGVAGAGILPPRGVRATPRATRVAGTASLSGELASFGEPVRRALELWVQRVNAERAGPGGAEVLLRLEDDGGDAERARRQFEQLSPGADLLIAPYGSRLTGAVLPVIERIGRPCLAPSAGDVRLWEVPRRWTAQLINPSQSMLHAVLDAAARSGARTAVFVHGRDPFSDLVFKGALRHASRRGLEVLSVRTYGEANEAASAVAALGDAAAADLAVGMAFRPGAAGAGFLHDALLLRHAFRRSSRRPRLLCLGIGAADPAFARGAGTSAEGVLGTTGWRPYLRTPGNPAFVNAYRRQWGTEPDIHAAQVYAAGQVFARAWKRASGAGTRLGAAALRDGIFGLRTETVFGAFGVDGHGAQVAKTNAVVQWRRGQPVVVWPQRYADGALEFKS